MLEIASSSNVTLEGSGGLKAPGSGFWKERYFKAAIRGYVMLKVSGSSSVSVRGLRLRNSPMYHINVMNSQKVLLERLDVGLDFFHDLKKKRTMCDTEGAEVN